MDKAKFQQLLKNPDSLESEDVIQLQQIVRDYPYFHNAHLLLLYGMHRLIPDKYNEQLKHSSVCLTSRAELIRAIVNGWPVVSKGKTDVAISREVELTPVVEAEPQPAAIPDIEPAEQELDLESSALRGSVELNVGKEQVGNDEIIIEEPSVDESFTFSLEDSQPIEILDKKEEDASTKQELPNDLLEFDLNPDQVEEPPSEDLIDHFLKLNPRIVPRLELDDKRGDISVSGLEENDEIVTETLASIFEQQGHYLKAIDAYQKLILKFPEKSTYFANRIQELEKQVK